MPDITLTLTQTQVDKLLTAIGYAINADHSPATGPQARAWLIEQVRVLVRQYDRSQVLNAGTDAAKATSIAAGW